MSSDPLPPDSPIPLTPAPPAWEVVPANPTMESAFTPTEYDPLRVSGPVTRLRPAADRMTHSRLRMWLIIGGVIWAIGLAGWLLLAVQGCESTGDSNSPTKKRK